MVTQNQKEYYENNKERLQEQTRKRYKIFLDEEKDRKTEYQETCKNTSAENK